MGVLIMSGRILERSLVEYAAPTLAGLKTASLFCVPMLDDWQSQVSWWNNFLHEKGLSLQRLRCQEGRVLLYLYRPAQLQRDIQQPGVKEFLAGYGYGEFGTTEAVARLQHRLAQGTGFPHEIGIFLGYPLGDVEGFIRNGGKNCKCCGCWKVYCNELEARKRFAQIDKCRRIYTRLYHQGRSVLQLTVAA